MCELHTFDLNYRRRIGGAASEKNNKKSRVFDLVLILKTEAANLGDNLKIVFSDLHNPPVGNFGLIHRRNLCHFGFEKIRENLPRHRHFLEKFLEIQPINQGPAGPVEYLATRKGLPTAGNSSLLRSGRCGEPPARSLRWSR